MNRYNEIRKLLELYYEGRTTRTQESELTEFFANAGSLPADLEADRRLFGQLTDMSEEEIVIPDEHDTRITSALEAEMARERTASRSRSRWRKILIGAGSAAACLLACLPLIRSFVDGADNPATDTTPVQTARNAAIIKSAVGPAAGESSPLIAAAEPVKSTTVIAVTGSGPASVKAVKTYGQDESYGKGDSEDDHIEDISPDEGYHAGHAYLSEEEEDRLVADNYYVVEDEREAYAIVNSVFSRLGDNMAEGSSRVSDISSEYEIEMTKLYN